MTETKGNALYRARSAARSRRGFRLLDGGNRAAAVPSVPEAASFRHCFTVASPAVPPPAENSGKVIDFRGILES